MYVVCDVWSHFSMAAKLLLLLIMMMMAVMVVVVMMKQWCRLVSWLLQPRLCFRIDISVLIKEYNITSITQQ